MLSGSNSLNETSSNNNSANNSVTCTDSVITLKVMSWNIQGIGQKFEIEETRQSILEYVIVFHYETMKLDSYDPQIAGYHYFHCQKKFQTSES